jgi:hypothetical protein
MRAHATPLKTTLTSELQLGDRPYGPWDRLNFLPDPHQHGSFRPSFGRISTPRRLVTALNGKLLYEGMGLHEGDEDDVRELSEAFGRLGTIDADEPGGTNLIMVVPRGKPPEIQRVEIGQRVMRFPNRDAKTPTQDQSS